MSIKKHLQGGTLRGVMAAEIKRCLLKYGAGPQPIDHAALELGITPKTLRLWKGPVDKGGWEELQVPAGLAMEAIMKATKKSVGKKIPAKKKVLKKTPPKTAKAVQGGF